jgi:protein transport protein SEC24
MSNRRRAYPQPAYNPELVGNAPIPQNNILQQQQPQQDHQQQQTQQQTQQQQQFQFGGSPYDQLNSGMQNLSLNNNYAANHISSNYNQPAYPEQPGYLQPSQQLQSPAQPQYQNGQPIGQPFNQPNQYQQGPLEIPMNQLYSTDLLKDLPPPIIDLQFPPPPINLPSSVSVTSSNESNASSDFIRSTLNVVPNSNSLLKKSKLPFALVIRPYLSLTDEESPIPIINDGIITRCRRCRSYLNPFVEIRNDRQKWKCNFCALLNDFPNALNIDTNQLLSRYEFNYGVNEFIATPEYMVRAPQSLNLVFLLDITKNTIQNGLLATTVRTILDSLDRIPNDQSRANVSFIGIDKKLYYFSIPNDNEIEKEISMMVVSPSIDDDDDIIIPSADDLMVNLKHCRSNIEKLLNNLSSYFVDNQSIDFDLANGLKSGHSLLSNIGGKMIVISSTMPNIGKGKLTIRDEASVSGKSKESTTLLTSNNSFYKSFAIDCNKSQITVDMFLASSTYQDVATLSNLTKFTAGQTHFYPAWNASNLEDITKFSKEFSNHLSMEIALEAVMRVRCSDGLKGNSYYGNFFSRSSDLLSFPSFPRDQSYVVEINIDNDIRRNVVYFQTAVLHTTCHGDRRIRVLTLALPVSKDLKNIYASADQLSITNYFSHVAIEKTLTNSLDNARDYLNKSVLDILLTYKKEIVAGNIGSSSPLQISTNLRMLPLLIQSLTKHIAFRNGNVPSDHRSSAINKLNSLPINELIQYIYPSIYSLHDMLDECGLPYEGEDNYDEIIPKIHGEIILPECINSSFNYLQRFGLYLIQTNNEIFIYIGGDAVEQLIFDVFGVNNINEILTGKHELPELDNEFNIRVRNIVNKIREGKGSIRYENVYIVIGPSSQERGNEMMNRDLVALRMWSMSALVEDRTTGVAGYKEYLSQLKDKINA